MGRGTAEGVNNCEQGRGDEDSPRGNEDTEDDGAEEGSPPGYAGSAVENVRTDNEAFEGGDCKRKAIMS